MSSLLYPPPPPTCLYGKLPGTSVWIDVWTFFPQINRQISPFLQRAAETQNILPQPPQRQQSTQEYLTWVLQAIFTDTSTVLFQLQTAIWKFFWRALWINSTSNKDIIHVMINMLILQTKNVDILLTELFFSLFSLSGSELSKGFLTDFLNTVISQSQLNYPVISRKQALSSWLHINYRVIPRYTLLHRNGDTCSDSMYLAQAGWRLLDRYVH